MRREAIKERARKVAKGRAVEPAVYLDVAALLFCFRGIKNEKVVSSPHRKNKKTLKMMPLSRLLSLPATGFVEHLVAKGLLAKVSNCPQCGKEVNLKQSTNSSDGMRYKRRRTSTSCTASGGEPPRGVAATW